MKRHLNLIPVATQRRHATRRVLRVFSTALVASIACAGLLLGVEWVRGMTTMQELQELDARYAPFAEIGRKSDELTDQVAKLRAREQLTLRLSRDEHGIALLGALSIAARESAGSVYIEGIRYRVDDGKQTSRTLSVQGAGVDSGAIAGFADELRRTGVFESVAVESTGAMPGGAVNLRQFSVACRL